MSELMPIIVIFIASIISITNVRAQYQNPQIDAIYRQMKDVANEYNEQLKVLSDRVAAINNNRHTRLTDAFNELLIESGKLALLLETKLDPVSYGRALIGGIPIIFDGVRALVDDNRSLSEIRQLNIDFLHYTNNVSERIKALQQQAAQITAGNSPNYNVRTWKSVFFRHENGSQNLNSACDVRSERGNLAAVAESAFSSSFLQTHTRGSFQVLQTEPNYMALFESIIDATNYGVTINSYYLDNNHIQVDFMLAGTRTVAQFLFAACG